MYKTKVKDEKKQEVKDIQNLFSEYPVVGLVDMSGLPTLQLQRIKKQLKGVIIFKMSKKRLVRFALKESKLKNADKLIEYLNDIMPALLFTKENPFKLYKKLAQNKSSTKAKPGQKAPNDLIVQAGPTNFIPGPIIGELGAMGLKAGVEGGKIVIKKDKVLVKKGEEISEKAADLLAKLGMEPMEVGLNLVVSYEDGEILTSDILGVSEEEYVNNIKLAYSQTMALAKEIGYISKDNIEMLIRDAQVGSIAILENVKYPEDEIKEEIKEAEKQAGAIKEKVDEHKVEEPKVEEKPVEEKKEEVKPVEEIKPEEKVVDEKPVEKKETPLEKEMKKEKEPEAEKAPQDFGEENKLEMKQEIKQGDVEIAQEVLQRITDQKIEQDKKKEKPKIGMNKVEIKKVTPEEKDLNNIINDLKDKKSRGEL